MTVRRFVLVTHRWIGLSTSVILMVTGATGALLLWPNPTVLGRAAGRLHETLALGRAGAWIVLAATLGAVLLQAGGLVLWWRRKSVAVRLGAGWRRAVTDLHHATGIVALAVMFVLAVSGIGMGLSRLGELPELRGAFADWHTARIFPFPVKLLYAIATSGLAVQGLTGVLMWWRPGGASPRAPGRLAPDRRPSGR